MRLTLCIAACSLGLMLGCSDRAVTPDLSGAVARSDGSLPTLDAVTVTGDVAIDGKLDEPHWSATGGTGWLVGPGDGQVQPRSPVNAEGWMAWDESSLYVGIVVYDRAPSTPFSPEDVDPHLWEKSSAVELMIQPGDPGNNTVYYEIQVDTAKAVWDTRFDDYNKPITVAADKSKTFGHQDWKSELDVGVDVSAGRYTVELAIPWTSLVSPNATSPPAIGDVWRMNIYSFRDGQRQALAWSPILRKGNFHKSSRFGRVRFAK